MGEPEEPEIEFGESPASSAPRSMEDLLDGARLGAAHVRLWLLSAFGIALDGFDFFIIGAAIPLLRVSPWRPDAWALGAVAAAALVGSVLGSVLLGPLADRIGRRKLYILDPLFFAAMSLAAACAWNIESLIVARLLLGVGIGADYPISASYVSETMPARHRGKLVASTIGFQAIGMMMGVVCGLVCALTLDTVSAWRWMVGIGAAPAVLLCVYRLSVPDSPRWLLARGHTERARAATSELTGIPRGKLPLEWFKRPARKAVIREPGVRDLFGPSLRGRTILACVPWFLMDIATYGIGIFTPSVLMSLHLEEHGLEPSGHAPLLVREIASLEGAAFLDLFLVIGFCIAIWRIDKVGRIPLQITGFLLMGVSLGLLALVGGPEGSVVVSLLAFVVFNTAMNAGPNTTTYVLPAELFPTALRATGHGFASASGKVGAAVGVFFLPVLQDRAGITATLLFIAGASMLGAVVTWVFYIETRQVALERLEVERR